MSRRFDIEFTSRVVHSSARNGTFEADVGDESASAPDAARPAPRVLSADGLHAINKWATSGDGERLIAEAVKSACAHLARTVASMDKALDRCDKKINALEARLLRQEEDTEQALKRAYVYVESAGNPIADAQNQATSALPTFASPPRRSARTRGEPAVPPSPLRVRVPVLGKRIRGPNAFAGTLGPFDSPVRMSDARPRSAYTGSFAHPMPVRPPNITIRRPQAVGSTHAFGLPSLAQLRTSEEEEEDAEECGL